ncbi:tetratricopeptide repeat protein [Phenylobacterium sp.]|uniref:NfrA family protein n=1 Tax=Phenylobacterium sp. TaxID=1871053 RepID=UPI0035B0AEC4
MAARTLVLALGAALLAPGLGRAAEAPAARAAAPQATAYNLAAAGYSAFGSGDYAGAADLARAAVQVAPDNRDYRLLLMQALANAGRAEEAEAAAAEIERRFGPAPEVAVQRGHLAVARRDPAAAAEQFARALATPGLDPAAARLARLGLFDARMTLNRPQEAAAALEGLPADSYEVRARRAMAAEAAAHPAEAAQAQAAAAELAPTAESRAYMIRGQVMSLVALERRAEARQVFDAALRAGALDASDPMDVAMVAVAVGDDATALAWFARAEAAGGLKGRAALDAAYAAKRLGRDEAAARYFRLGLARARAGEFALAPQAEMEIRRDVAAISRRWGFNGYVGYGGAGAAAPPTGGRGVAQAGGEAYWRAGGYRSGRTVEVFARAFETVASDRGDPTGGETLQGWLGVRHKPFESQNLVFEASRMIRLGRLSRDDWMLRAAYSAGEGLDLRLDEASWPMWSAYVDMAHLLDAGQTLGAGELRLGRSLRLSGGADGGLVLSPFLGAAAGYDDSLERPLALGWGPGLAGRYWMGGTPDQAPRSYVEMALQFRWRITGDDRADGLFATFNLAY